MRVAVHGSTGAQGGPVSDALAAAGHDVVAISRSANTEDPRSVAADLTDQSSLETAYASADAVFVHLPIPSAAQGPAQWVPAVLGALSTANVQRVVLSTSGASLSDAGPAPSLQERYSGTKAFYEGLQGVAGSVVALAPRLFLENLLLPFVSGPALSDGVLAYPLAADKPISWISHRDVAEAVVIALEDATAPGAYDLGTPAIAGHELADRIGSGLGRAITYEAITPAEFASRATPLFGPEMAAAVSGLYEAFATDHTLEIPDENPQLGLNRRLSIENWVRQTQAWRES